MKNIFLLLLLVLSLPCFGDATTTLAQRATGETITASFFNDITNALDGDFVGRNSSGVPTSGQALGTATFPWGDLRATTATFTGTVTAPTLSVSSSVNSAQVQIQSGGGLYIYRTNNGAAVGFVSDASTANQTYTLPAAYPTTSGQFLKSTTAGVMSWSTHTGTTGTATSNLVYSASPTFTGTVNSDDLALSAGGGSTLGVGTSADATIGVAIYNTGLTGVSQYGSVSGITGSSASTTSLNGFATSMSTANASYTTAALHHFYALPIGKGASMTITRQIDFRGTVRTDATNNAIFTDNAGFTGNYFIHQSGSELSVLPGGVRGKHSDANTTAIPTNAELVSAYGAAATTGQGFVATLDDADGHSTGFLIWSDGTKYWYATGTAAP